MNPLSKRGTLWALLGAAFLRSAVRAASTDIAPPAAEKESGALFGDWGGMKPFLEGDGVSLSFHYTGEAQGNPVGGFRQGLVYQGVLSGSVEADLEKTAHWHGARFRAEAYNIHGKSLTENDVGDLNFISNIDGADGTRLVELWFEQNWMEDRLSLRLGQLTLDSEFAVSEPAAIFANSAFGALPTMSLNVPSPIYPQGTPGIRARVNPAEPVSLQAAVYQGNPGDPARDGGGTRWHFDGEEGALGIIEVGVDTGGKEYPGAYRLGAFAHTGTFPDVLTGAQEGGQRAVYAAGHQRVYRAGAAGESTIDLFGRASAVLEPSRSVVDLHFDGGFNWSGPLPSRPEDCFGFGAAYTRLGHSFRETIPTPPRSDYEAIFELTYHHKLPRGVSIEPDLQYIAHPGGSAAIPNALVLGLRFEVEL